MYSSPDCVVLCAAADVNGGSTWCQRFRSRMMYSLDDDDDDDDDDVLGVYLTCDVT